MLPMSWGLVVNGTTPHTTNTGFDVHWVMNIDGTLRLVVAAYVSQGVAEIPQSPSSRRLLIFGLALGIKELSSRRVRDTNCALIYTRHTGQQGDLRVFLFRLLSAVFDKDTSFRATLSIVTLIYYSERAPWI